MGAGRAWLHPARGRGSGTHHEPCGVTQAGAPEGAESWQRRLCCALLPASLHGHPEGQDPRRQPRVALRDEGASGCQGGGDRAGGSLRAAPICEDSAWSAALVDGPPMVCSRQTPCQSQVGAQALAARAALADVCPSGSSPRPACWSRWLRLHLGTRGLGDNLAHEPWELRGKEGSAFSLLLASWAAFPSLFKNQSLLTIQYKNQTRSFQAAQHRMNASVSFNQENQTNLSESPGTARPSGRKPGLPGVAGRGRRPPTAALPARGWGSTSSVPPLTQSYPEPASPVAGAPSPPVGMSAQEMVLMSGPCRQQIDRHLCRVSPASLREPPTAQTPAAAPTSHLFWQRQLQRCWPSAPPSRCAGAGSQRWGTDFHHQWHQPGARKCSYQQIARLQPDRSCGQHSGDGALHRERVSQSQEEQAFTASQRAASRARAGGASRPCLPSFPTAAGRDQGPAGKQEP